MNTEIFCDKLGELAFLACMLHDVVEPAGGQDGVHPDHRLGHETDEVAGLGATGIDGLRDRLRDNLWVAHHVSRVLLAHTLGGLGGLSLFNFYWQR